MKKFAKDCRGAVTVLVTLLLIPAVLISGTAVDTARIYAARSLLHDANQLAANAALASYDALLQDMYGLYGYLHSDQELADMVDQYINMAIQGDDPPKGMGTFQIFYGSNLQPGSIQPAANQNLANPAVLRRQIEEYVKFRAPVIIAERILSMLDKFEKVGQDSQAIQTKLEIEEGIEELDALYKKIYDQIQVVNGYAEKGTSLLASLNGYQQKIYEQLKEMKETRTSYTEAEDAELEEEANDWDLKYKGLLENINHLITGGTIQSGWQPGDFDDEGQWQDGAFSIVITDHGLNSKLKDGRDYVEEAESSLVQLAKYCQEAQDKKASLQQKIDDLEQQLKSGKCSEELVDGMTVQKQPDTDKTLLETYRALLGYDVAAMAEAVVQRNSEHLTEMERIINDFTYGKHSTQQDISLQNLRTLHTMDGFAIDLIIKNRNRPAGQKREDQLDKAVRNGYEAYVLPEGKTYLKFQDQAFSSTKNPEFYTYLVKLCNSSSESKKDAVEAGLGDMLGEIQSFFKKGFAVELEGARYFQSEGTASGTGFGADGDWSDKDTVLSETDDALEDNLFDQLGNLAGMATDKILLVTYSTQMFSNYTTTSDPQVESMAGIPMGVRTNYFFQSEQEYLFAGRSDSAAGNVMTVAGVLFLVRFVANYVVSFSIPEVNTFVANVTAAMAVTGPFAPLFGELARVVVVLGESAVDVARLRTGRQVVLFKSPEDWKLSLTGLIDSATGEVGDLSVSGLEALVNVDDDGPTAVTYSDYLYIFLLFLKSGDEIADRTADLIGWNVTNYKEGIGELGSQSEREAAMSQAEQFDMASAITDFSITTTVDLRMLFLSMPIARNSIDGVVPPGVVTISATDYRGY